jgi:hypothetical protein
MPDNTMTLRLDGVVLLKTYRAAVDRFTALISALTRARRARGIEWVIADLQPGSAMMTVEGIGDIECVLKVREAYEDIGDALARGERPLRYSKRVVAPAEALSRFVGHGIESVTFETERVDLVICHREVDDVVRFADAVPLHRSPPAGQVTAGTGAGPDRRTLPPAYGAVAGQVETLARRHALRFVLYDTLYNKAVSCYLAEGSEEVMRGVWGRWATVEGLVTRDPVSGRPLSVRRITKVTPRPERATSFRDARGASPDTGILPEDLVRRIRDAR